MSSTVGQQREFCFVGIPPFKARTGFGWILGLEVALKLQVEPAGKDAFDIKSSTSSSSRLVAIVVVRMIPLGISSNTKTRGDSKKT